MGGGTAVEPEVGIAEEMREEDDEPEVEDITEEELVGVPEDASDWEGVGVGVIIAEVSADDEGAVVVGAGVVLGGGVKPPYVHTPSVPSGI